MSSRLNKTKGAKASGYLQDVMWGKVPSILVLKYINFHQIMVLYSFECKNSISFHEYSAALLNSC